MPIAPDMIEAPPARPGGRARRLAAAVPAFLARHRIVFAAFLASRLALLAAGLLTQVFIAPIAAHPNQIQLAADPMLSIWGQWDSGWYLGLATHGYQHHPMPNGQVNWVFFPAYPFLSAALSRLFGLPLFGALLIVSNLSFLGALLLAHRLARQAFDQRTADLAAALLCVAPGSYIFSAAYTESLFLFALAGCLVLLEAERWLAAGAFAALAVLTRNVGLALMAPFAMAGAARLAALWREPGGERRDLAWEAIRMALGLALPVLALAGFCLLLYRTTGDPLAFVTGQKAWNRHLGNPFAEPWADLVSPRRLSNENLFSFAACWLSVILMAVLAAMRRWRLLVLAILLTVVPLAAGLASFGRYALVVLPLFLAAARLLAPRPAAAAGALAVCATLNGWLMAAWTLGLWVQM